MLSKGDWDVFLIAYNIECHNAPFNPSVMKSQNPIIFSVWQLYVVTNVICSLP